jgi:hypothetical protein
VQKIRRIALDVIIIGGALYVVITAAAAAFGLWGTWQNLLYLLSRQ